MEKIELTEEIVLGCNSYINLMDKVKFAEYISERSIDKVKITAGDSGEDDGIPDMYKENAQRKSRYLMGVLAKFYIGIPFEPVEGETFMLDAVDYDKLAGGHILNQMERMKRSQSKEVRERVFDLLYDYREFEKRVNREISALLLVMNDPTTRLLQAQKAQLTPDVFLEAQEELKKLADELEKYQEAKAEKKDPELKVVAEVTGEQARPKQQAVKRKKKTDSEGE